MRKVIVLCFITLDGVIQAPGGPEEDISNDFKYGGWTVPFFDEFGGNIMDEQMRKPFDLLLGRMTYYILPLTGRSMLRGGRASTKQPNMWLHTNPWN